MPLHENTVEGKAQHAAPLRDWIALTFPLLPLIAWTIYYHHRTGYWTGNAEYLQYNLYTTLDPGRVFWTLMRRLYEVSVGGFNWVLVVGAALGVWWTRSHRDSEAQRAVKEQPEEVGNRVESKPRPLRALVILAAGLTAAYILMLSAVGGAILPRYLLPVFPLFFVVTVVLIWRLPKWAARAICGVAAGCFVPAWFINPPYPFPYEDNLSYADFIRLHQRAAQFLETQPSDLRILTAWPASDELTRPFLGYVRRPLRAVPMQGFTEDDFGQVAADSFDILYLYSRKWEPPDNWLARFPAFLDIQQRHFDYAPQVDEGWLKQRYNLRLVQQFERRGQWVRIYAGQESEVRIQESEDKNQPCNGNPRKSDSQRLARFHG